METTRASANCTIADDVEGTFETAHRYTFYFDKSLKITGNSVITEVFFFNFFIFVYIEKWKQYLTISNEMKVKAL